MIVVLISPNQMCLCMWSRWGGGWGCHWGQPLSSHVGWNESCNKRRNRISSASDNMGMNICGHKYKYFLTVVLHYSGKWHRCTVCAHTHIQMYLHAMHSNPQTVSLLLVSTHCVLPHSGLPCIQFNPTMRPITPLKSPLHIHARRNVCRLQLN